MAFTKADKKRIRAESDQNIRALRGLTSMLGSNIDPKVVRRVKILRAKQEKLDVKVRFFLGQRNAIERQINKILR